MLKRTQEAKKIEKLKSSLHFLDEIPSGEHIVFGKKSKRVKKQNLPIASESLSGLDPVCVCVCVCINVLIIRHTGCFK